VYLVGISVLTPVRDKQVNEFLITPPLSGGVQGDTVIVGTE